MMLLLQPSLYHLMIVLYVLLKLFDLFVQSTSPLSLKAFVLLLFIFLLLLICLTIFLSLTLSSTLWLIYTLLLKLLPAHIAEIRAAKGKRSQLETIYRKSKSSTDFSNFKLQAKLISK